jgi:hypothetical protein
MKRILSLLAVILTQLPAAHALPNLIVNGDFTGDILAPWISTGTPTVTGGVVTLNNATISQTVATVAGARYYFAMDPNLGFSGTSTLTLTAGPAGGGTDGTQVVPSSTGQIRGVLIFTASTASTKLSLVGTFVNIGGFATPPTVDNAALFKLAPSRFVGKYTGTLTTKMISAALGLSQKAASRLVAIVNTDGRIVIFNDATRIYGGQLFNDGGFDINFGNFLRSTGTATFTGDILDLKVPSGNFPGIDEGGGIINATSSMRVMLTRSKS